MGSSNLRIKFSHGDMVIELEGESSTVLSELRSLKKEGVGKLVEFFGVAVEHPPTQDSGQPRGKARPPAPSKILRDCRL